MQVRGPMEERGRIATQADVTRMPDAERALYDELTEEEHDAVRDLPQDKRAAMLEAVRARIHKVATAPKSKFQLELEAKQARARRYAANGGKHRGSLRTEAKVKRRKAAKAARKARRR